MGWYCLTKIKAQNRIAKLRKEKKISQAQLAKKTGLTRQAISLYEIGKREPKLETWLKLAEFFDVPTPYLQGVSNYSKKDEEELNRLSSLMFNENGEPNWEAINKVSDIEKILSIDDYSKRQFEEANLIIDTLFSRQPEDKEKYKNIISNSKFTNGPDELPEPVSTYTSILGMVSEMFFSAQSGDTVAKKCIKEIDDMYFGKYDEHRVKEAHKKFIKSNNDSKNKPTSKRD